MNVLIVGAGRFGKALAEFFVKEHHTVVVMDKDENKIRGIEDTVAQALILDSTDEAAVTHLNLSDFDYVFLCISEISSSILTAQILQEAKVKNIYAKASNEVHAKILSRLGVSRVIQPEKQSAERLAYSIIMGAEELVDLLRKKNFMIATVDVPKNFQRKTLGELEIKRKYGVYVIAVERNRLDVKDLDKIDAKQPVIGVDTKTETFVLPDATFELMRTDKLVVIGTSANIEEFREYVSKEIE
ncbi:MAG TPA: TrkA family potassium uptake protein [Candidatus Hydrothermia bacterium]|nr:TrkA family potassium uptake protein [Candidatus Hydrothermae bacterium]MDD3648815.1 TrkA family potassium uptake protein [Candidatus Hydrothermia bacterium]MDD5573485.1 TrkA family potassium uptake protein [Candidatus Hydrothermia bacterium]HOK23320.1 TrkA family potassium uptake protein [Candidatus Hydrothermia bacterium]HOL24129.1 TrkA family potassium uptake protein [Candidatus Hydrothermia bacterium]